MRRARVVQQYVMTASDGGLKTEYEALSSRKALSDYYEFVPVVLNNCHCGISLSDIRFTVTPFAKRIRYRPHPGRRNGKSKCCSRRKTFRSREGPCDRSWYVQRFGVLLADKALDMQTCGGAHNLWLIGWRFLRL